MRFTNKGQAGFSFSLFALVVLLIVAGVVAMKMLERKVDDGGRGKDTRERFNMARNSLVAFVSQNERLPCPADPSLDTGDAAPVGASAACTYPAGTLPWKTLGMRRDDAYDSWGWKISYRVYAGGVGNVGSLTQDKGASAVNCDTVETWPGGATALGTCRANQDTLPTEYFTGKGFSVNDFGTLHAPSIAGDGAAFVLISHGPSGLGAYTAAGTPTALPTSADELSNVAASATFVAKASNVRDISPSDASYFDDLIAYATLADLVASANVAARDWPDPGGPASVKLDTATLTAALERPPAYGDLGQSSINFTNARVSGFSSGGTSQNLDFESVNSLEGIGGVTGGNGALNSANGEGVRIDFNQGNRRFALALNDFGTGTYLFLGFFPVGYAEQAQLDFYSAGVLKETVIVQGCRADGGLATFQDIDVGGGFLFDRVDITSIAGTFPLASSSFFVSEFKTCAAGVTCQTSLQTAGNLCP